MADSQHPSSDPPPLAPAGPRVLLVTLGIVVIGALLGIAGGFVWAALAPRAVFMVSAPGTAYVVNPETTAFIAADGWFSIVAAGGGILTGVAGYLIGVRRYGPVPAAGALAGAIAAAFLASWTGRHVGLAAFRHELSVAKTGALIRQPVLLGAHGALAFWPLAAGVAIGAIEMVAALRERRRHPSPAPAHRRAAPRPAGREAGRDLR
jgi:hypothetical protein